MLFRKEKTVQSLADKKTELEIQKISLEIEKLENEAKSQKVDTKIKQLTLLRLAIQIPLTAVLLSTAIITLLSLYH